MRSLLFAVAIVCILLAGYRGAIFEIGIIFAITTYLRGDAAKLGRFFAVGSLGLLLLVLMQGTVFNLPPTIQRTLSFLPGKWDTNVLVDANFSKQWRMEMWERMLNSDRYIESKWLGDGFGLTAMALQQSQTALASNSPEQMQETYLVSGIVHSGPVSTIRYVGYLGLFIFLTFLIVCARVAWLVCRECRGTPYFLMSLLICAPIIYKPIGYVLIYGAYDYDLPHSLVVAGLLKMLRTSIREYRASEQALKPALTPSFGEVPGGRPIPAHLQY